MLRSAQYDRFSRNVILSIFGVAQENSATKNLVFPRQELPQLKIEILHHRCASAQIDNPARLRCFRTSIPSNEIGRLTSGECPPFVLRNN